MKIRGSSAGSVIDCGVPRAKRRRPRCAFVSNPAVDRLETTRVRGRMGQTAQMPQRGQDTRRFLATLRRLSGTARFDPAAASGEPAPEVTNGVPRDLRGGAYLGKQQELLRHLY
jgi:hypothetical protein